MDKLLRPEIVERLYESIMSIGAENPLANMTVSECVALKTYLDDLEEYYKEHKIYLNLKSKFE